MRKRWWALIIFGLALLLSFVACTQPSTVVPPQEYEKSCQLYYEEQWTFPIYLAEGQQLHLHWSTSRGDTYSGYFLPNGAYFGLHNADKYWLRYGNLGMKRTFGSINIKVGEIYDSITSSSGVLVPGGVYEPGYYTIYFESAGGIHRQLANDEEFMKAHPEIDVEDTTIIVHVRYWIE